MDGLDKRERERERELWITIVGRIKRSVTKRGSGRKRSLDLLR